MTSEELLRGIGGLNPRYVAEAEAYRAPAVRPWLKWAALAACLAARWVWAVEKAPPKWYTGKKEADG